MVEFERGGIFFRQGGEEDYGLMFRPEMKTNSGQNIEIKQVRNQCVYSRPGDRVWH